MINGTKISILTALNNYLFKLPHDTYSSPVALIKIWYLVFV